MNLMLSVFPGLLVGAQRGEHAGLPRSLAPLSVCAAAGCECAGVTCVNLCVCVCVCVEVCARLPTRFLRRQTTRVLLATAWRDALCSVHTIISFVFGISI